jgi:hypothetical protein
MPRRRRQHHKHRKPGGGLESSQLGDVSQGQMIAPRVSPDSFGTITCAFTRGGTNWVMTCSHVASPSGLGHDTLTLATGLAEVQYFTELGSGSEGCAIDVAIASTLNGIDDPWRDGEALGATGSLADAEGPFTFFGATRAGSASFSSFEPARDVEISLASGAVVSYAGQHRFLLDGAAVAHGDSGGAVRDARGRLIGILVGCDADGAGYFTPIDRVKAWLASQEP